MNSFSIACKNFKHNVKIYGLHLMAMTFSVFVYYNFISLKYNPQILKLEAASQYVLGTSNVTSFILLVFLIFFIWFSSSFFLNQRKKEIGVYAFMGVNNSQIASIFAIEGILIGITAIAAGLSLGVLFGKLFMMLLSKVALLNIQVEFFLSIQGLANTAATFLTIFILTSIKGYFDITRSKLIDLFNASRKEEGLPKVNYFKGVASIFLIGLGYYTSSIARKMGFSTYALITIILVVWGTYWLFGSFFSMSIRYLINKKSILYNGVNIVSISNIAFRIKKNYKTLATIAVLIATTVTIFGTITSLRYFVNETHDIELPYSFSYISDDSEIKERVREVINKSDHDILLEEEANFLYVDADNASLRAYDKGFVVVRFTDFEKITLDLNVKDAEKLINNTKPNKGEAIYIERPGVIMSLMNHEYIKADNFNFIIKTKIKTPLFGNGLRKVAIVVNDEDYKVLKESFKEYQFNGIKVTNQVDSLDLAMKLHEIKHIEDSLFAYLQSYYGTYEPIGIIYFLGAFLSLVFVIATGSIIYFKLLSDAFGDKGKYEILIKVGMDKREVAKAISSQVGISFLLPLIIGTIHSIFAILVLSDMLSYNLIVPTIISIMTFILIYYLFYLLTKRKFLKIIY